MTTQIALRLPEDLLSRIDELVPQAHESRSAVIRRAAEFYVGWLANERDAAIYERLPLTDGELALVTTRPPGTVPPGGEHGCPAQRRGVWAQTPGGDRPVLV